MNKLFITVVVAFATLCSCTSKLEEYNKPVDISQIVAEYDKTNNDTVFRDSLYQMECRITFGDTVKASKTIHQDLCCATKWWTDVKSESEGNNLLQNAAQLYNIFAYYNSVYADLEIWERGLDSGYPILSNDSVINAISMINPEGIANDKFRKEAIRYRDDIVWCMKNVDKMSDDRNVSLAMQRYDSLVVRRYALLFLDKESFLRCEDKVDSTIARYDSIQQNIMKTPDGGGIRVMLMKIQKAKTFDDQCGILLSCSQQTKTYAFIWATKTMRVLLESGRYSLLLGRMWTLWRAFSQQDWCGVSRDSCIPNNVYDAMRKRVYETIIRYLEVNPKDLDAVAIAVTLAAHSNLERSGHFFFGNDAPIEIMTYCPDFYGTEDEKDDKTEEEMDSIN